MKEISIKYKMCQYQGGDWQYVGSMDLFNRHYQVEEDDTECKWCPWILLILLTIASTLGAIAQTSTTSCHHNMIPQVEEEFYTAEQLTIEAAFTIAPVGWIGRVGGLVLKPVVIKVGGHLALDAVQIARTFAVKNIVKTMSHPKLGKVILREGGQMRGWVHILQRHVKYFKPGKTGKDVLFTQNPVEVLNLMEKTLKFGSYKIANNGLHMIEYKGYRLMIDQANEVRSFFPIKN